MSNEFDPIRLIKIKPFDPSEELSPIEFVPELDYHTKPLPPLEAAPEKGHIVEAHEDREKRLFKATFAARIMRQARETRVSKSKVEKSLEEMRRALQRGERPMSEASDSDAQTGIQPS